jgi:hypothetical protein
VTRLEATLANIYSADDGLDVGEDSGAPVSPDYASVENEFNGVIKGVQLAIRNDGVIAGTYQNKATGETATVEGMVDQESQRAGWAFTGRSSPIVETGIQNLTMIDTQILVHFDDRTAAYLMVCVENPDA